MSLSTTIPSYLIGAATVAGGIGTFVAPRAAYQLFGLPLPNATDKPSSKDATTPSPYVYAMGVRQFSLGALVIAFEAAGNVEAVKTMAAVICLVGGVDGGIVWMNGGALKSKAWGHWNGTIMAAVYYGWRFWKR